MPSGRLTKNVASERAQAVRQKIAEGLNSAVDIARALHGTPRFENKAFRSTRVFISNFCSGEGIILSGPQRSDPTPDTRFPYKPRSGQTQPRQTPMREPLQVSPQAHPENGLHPIERFIEQFKINLPAGSYAEFTRFVLSLKKVTRAVEAEAALVPELRRQIAEMQGRIKEMEARTPDAALQEEIKRAREENERLQGIINRQAEQIAKWKMDNGFGGHRPLTADHLAVPPKPV